MKSELPPILLMEINSADRLGITRLTGQGSLDEDTLHWWFLDAQDPEWTRKVLRDVLAMPLNQRLRREVEEWLAEFEDTGEEEFDPGCVRPRREGDAGGEHPGGPSQEAGR